MAHITSVDGYLTDEDIENASKAFSKYEREDDKRPITTLLLGILLNGMAIEVFADSDPETNRFIGWLKKSAINAPGKAFGVQIQGTDDLKELVGKPGPYTVFFYHADHGNWKEAKSTESSKSRQLSSEELDAMADRGELKPVPGTAVYRSSDAPALSDKDLMDIFDDKEQK